jgi:hypothetical protein
VPTSTAEWEGITAGCRYVDAYVFHHSRENDRFIAVKAVRFSSQPRKRPLYSGQSRASFITAAKTILCSGQGDRLGPRASIPHEMWNDDVAAARYRVDANTFG